MSTSSPLATRERLVYLFDHGLFAIFVLFLFYFGNYIAPNAIPTPPAIIDAFATQVTEGPLIDATVNAIIAILTGFVIALVLGISLGLFMGLNWYAEHFLEPYVNGLFVLPTAAMVPAFIIWFGTGFQIRVFIVILFAVFPILINTYNGVKETPQELIDTTRSFGASRLYVIRNVIIPHEIPYISAGLRLGIALSVKALVIAELIVSVSGYGLIITRYTAAGQMGGVFSVVLVLVFLGISSVWIVGKIKDRLVHWDVSETD